MTKRVFLAVLALVSSIFVACEDDSSPSPGTVNLPPPVTIDGGGTGSPPPPPASDPPKGTGVRISVRHEGFFNRHLATPFADARVVFHGADGKVIGEARTDAAGKASTALPAKYLTVVNTRHGMITYADLEEGDELLLDDEDPSPGTVDPAGDLGSYSVSLSNLTAPAGADTYQVSVGGGCFIDANATAAPFVIKVKPSCYVEGGSGKADFLAKAIQSGAGFVAGFAWNRDIASAKKGETISGIGAAAGWISANVGTFRVVPGLPNAEAGVAFMHVFANDREYIFGNDGDPVQSEAEIQYPAGFSDDVGLEITVYFDQDFGNKRTWFKRVDRSASNADVGVIPDFTLNAATSNFLPALERVAVKVENGRAILTWSHQGGGANVGDALFALVEGRAGNPPTNFGWHILAKASTGSVVIPDLPPELKFDPQLGGSVTKAVIIDRDLGYKAFKSLPIDSSARSITRTLPKNSRIRMAMQGEF
jgi:hypothetical protein